MYFVRFCIAFFLFASPFVQIGSAQLSKGNQILLQRGLQLQGLAQDDCYLTLSTYSNANYTAIHWINSGDESGHPTHSSRPDWMGAAPGFPWARWVGNESQMPPQNTPYGGDETPYLSQLLALQLADEWNLNDSTVRDRLVNWFIAVRTNWPNTILFHNNWGSQIGDTELGDFYTRAKPDMLCFDTYPWHSVYDINQPDHIGAPISGSPTSWYGDLRRYREHARGAQIPFGIYRQTFHAVQDYDGQVFRDPSFTELRLNTFGALAFNAKVFIDFLYNTGAASLFTKTFNGSGDTLTNSNGLYGEMIDVNKRARNLGKALVRLKPVYDLHNPNTVNPPPGPASGDPNFPNFTTTGIMFLRGKYMSGGVTNFTDLPNSFANDPSSSANPSGTGQSYSWWESDKNDPYLRGWAVTNKAGIKNNGLLGEVILSWFTPLDENIDGLTYSNQVYMMVVNGLTDPTGNASNCLQEIRLNFVDTAATTNLVMLDPVTGLLQTNALPIVSTRRQLALNLNGGDAALFKFNTGAPFVGFYAQAPQLAANIENGSPTISIQGTIGSNCELKMTSSLSETNWTVLTNLVLPSSPFVFHGTVSSSNRFYRAVGKP